MSIIKQIKAMPKAGKRGDTKVYISFGVGDYTSDEFELADLIALAESHERLLKAASDALKHAVWELEPNCTTLQRLEDVLTAETGNTDWHCSGCDDCKEVGK